MNITSQMTRALFVGALALSIGAAPAAWAAGSGCSTQKADQEQLGQNTGPAQKADQEQLGQNVGRAQRADQEQFGAQGNTRYAMNNAGKC